MINLYFTFGMIVIGFIEVLDDHYKTAKFKGFKGFWRLALCGLIWPITLGNYIAIIYLDNMEQKNDKK